MLYPHIYNSERSAPDFLNFSSYSVLLLPTSTSLLLTYLLPGILGHPNILIDSLIDILIRY